MFQARAERLRQLYGQSGRDSARYVWEAARAWPHGPNAWLWIRLWHAADASADAFLDCCRRDSIIVAAEMWSHTDKANTHVDSCNVRYRRFRMGLPTPGLPTLLGEAGRGCHTYRQAETDRHIHTYKYIYVRTPARMPARPHACMHARARCTHKHARTHTPTPRLSHHPTPTPT